jgi:hypothetical protein
VLAGLKVVGHEYGERLATHALSRIKVAETVEASCPESCLLSEFPPSECCWVLVLPVRRSALRKLPGPVGNRIAVLLNKVESVTLDRNDEREVWLFDIRVDTLRPVRALDHIFAKSHPLVVVYDPGGDPLDREVVGFRFRL